VRNVENGISNFPHFGLFMAFNNLTESCTMKINFFLACLLVPFSYCVQAAPFTVSSDQQEVTDVKTGLTWRRCPEGMTQVAGACNGAPTSFTQNDAMRHASGPSGNFGLWRVPNIKELSSIIVRSRDASVTSGVSGIDRAAFPGVPTNMTSWSSTSNSNFSCFVVSFDFGTTKTLLKTNNAAVWLVRDPQLSAPPGPPLILVPKSSSATP
jgi:Protein of unknown function (DUF1566)